MSGTDFDKRNVEVDCNDDVHSQLLVYKVLQWRSYSRTTPPTGEEVRWDGMPGLRSDSRARLSREADVDGKWRNSSAMLAVGEIKAPHRRSHE
jgi:hypothetical protein